MEESKDLEDYDGLDVKNIPQIMNQFREDEVLHFSGNVTKFNKRDWKQERIFVITNLAVYNIKKHKVQRRILISDIDGITKSTDPRCFEFVIHVEVEYDYRFLTTERKRDDIFKVLKHCFYKIFEKNLPVFGVAYSHLKDFTTSKNEAAKKISKKPPKGNLLQSEDIFRDKWYKGGSNSKHKKSKKKSSKHKKKKEISSNGDFEMLSVDEIEERKNRASTGTIYCKTKGKQVELNDFERIKVIGKGTFGKVYLVRK